MYFDLFRDISRSHLFSVALNNSSGKYLLSSVRTEERGALSTAFLRDRDAYGSSSTDPVKSMEQFLLMQCNNVINV